MEVLLEKINSHNPLISKTYKLKNPVVDFYCPLCGTQRELAYRSRLITKNYIHVTLISLLLIIGFYPQMGIKALIWPVIVWAIYESVLKLLFRKEIPCPHCGFDATWYKKDVKIAREMVDTFWAKKNMAEVPENQEPIQEQ